MKSLQIMKGWFFRSCFVATVLAVGVAGVRADEAATVDFNSAKTAALAAGALAVAAALPLFGFKTTVGWAKGVFKLLRG